MATVLTIHHMSGAGNRFVVVDARRGALPHHDAIRLAPALCRRDGVSLPPAEGLLVLRTITNGSFTGDFYNPDGSFGAMCGNGGRCIVRFAVDQGLRPEADGRIPFHLSGGAYVGSMLDGATVSVEFPPPLAERSYPAGTLPGIEVDVDYVDVRSDHAVVYVDPAGFDPGPLRHHASFPRGVNVNMVRMETNDTLRLDTYERGVEGVTGACGTGALSTALSAWRRGYCPDHSRIIPPSGNTLRVTILHQGDTVTGLVLTGDAVYDCPATNATSVDGTYAEYR